MGGRRSLEIALEIAIKQAMIPVFPEFAGGGFLFRGWGSGVQGVDAKSGRSVCKPSWVSDSVVSR